MKRITIMTVLFFALSCSDNAKTGEKEIINETQTVQDVVGVKPPAEVLETLPNDIRLHLIENVTGVEGTMYESGGSFSLSDENSAKNFINFIKNEAPVSRSKQQVGHLLLLDKKGDQLSLITVFRDDNMVYTKYTDSETEKSYYNVLTGQPSDLFLNVEIKKVSE